MPVGLIDRERSPVAILLDPKTDIPIGERDIRLEDYLDDKIQAAADFENLTILLESVELQKTQLEEQLEDAKTKLAEARKAAKDHTSTMADQTQLFEEQQQSLRERMMIITSSSTPQEAVARLEGPMEKLRQVELAQAYVELLTDVDGMTKEACANLPADPQAALRPYVRLRELAIALRAAQEPAEGAAVHLVSYVEQASGLLWTQMVHILTKEFNDMLTALKWPDPEVEPDRRWSDCFTRLLELQAPEIKDARGPLVLLPLSVMAKPLEKKFYYHFMGTLATANSSNLGEIFLPWIIGTVERYEPYLRDHVGPVLSAHFLGNPLAGNSLYVDPVSAFITALLPLARKKTDVLLEEIKNQPPSLSKFINELITWDETIRTRFAYDGGNAELGWKGLTWDVLDVWFDRWMDAEEGFALKRYEEIVQDRENGQIDYDSNQPRRTKSTFGAAKITDLLKNITTLYQGLRRFSHKLRFFLHTQINILDRYQIRLADALEAYMSLTSAVGRTLQGYTKEQQMSAEGMAGLVSLSKVFCSADHIVMTLRELNSEDFFVELYLDLDERAQIADPDGNIAGPETYTNVRMSTSLKLGTGKGGMFDTTIHSFRAIKSRAEDLLQQAIKYAFPTAFRPYLTKAQWTTVGSEPLAMSLPDLNGTVSSELDQPLQTLRENMAFLDKTISYTAFMRIWRQAISTLEDLLWNEVLLKQDFTTLGAARFAQDLRGIQSVFGMYLDVSPGSTFSMKRLTQGVTLLNLPVESEEGMTLLEAGEKIYASKQDCEEVLRTLGLDLLNNTHARAIIQRRVEASE